jgi:hypothetical protein
MRATLALAVLALAGCATSLGSIGVLARDDDALSVKMLVPGAVGRSCRSSVVGLPLSAGDPTVDEALGQILARDAEGNVVTEAEVVSERLVTGVYNRRCVSVRGNLARMITTVTLPMPDHAGHH